MATETFITIPEAGRRLFGVNRAQAYALAQRGLLPTIRRGRRCFVPVAALERLVDELADSAAQSAVATWRERDVN